MVARKAHRLLSASIAGAGMMLAIAPSSAAPKKSEAVDCPWGYTQAHTCVDPKLAFDGQRANLVYSQQNLNRNFSAYLPADPNTELLYPLLTNEWWGLRINTHPGRSLD